MIKLFTRVPFKAWFFYVLFLLLLVYLAYLSIFPYLAERCYRDSYYFSVYKRHHFAIEDMEQAVKYAPYDAYYRVILGRYYQEYYPKLATDQQRLSLLHKTEANYLETLRLDEFNPWVYMYLVTV
eukprot:COSAG01_NODE_71_length_28648_cov_1587.432449_1_plen_124_part_10